MKNIKRILPSIIALVSLVSCSKVEPNHVPFADLESVVSKLPTNDMTIYSGEGNFNFFEMTPERYTYSANNKDLEKDSESFYLGAPLVLSNKISHETTSAGIYTDEDSFNYQFYEIIEPIFVSQDSIGKYYIYLNDDGGFSLKVFEINKRLFIIPNDSDLTVEATAKWNGELVYDENGRLVSESFSTMNSSFDPKSETIYGKATYSYAK